MDKALPNLPTGIVTFMMTDVEGSISLWEEYPQEMRAVLARHDELIESAVTLNAGIVIKPRGEGDSRFIVFDRATDAILAAVNIQLALQREQWIVPEQIRVRIALHTGEAEVRDGDYYGSPVNRCARLRSIAHGGQILLTQVTHGLVHDSIPAEINFLDLGVHRLKNIRQADRIFQVIAPDLPGYFPALRTPYQLLKNLPVSLTSFIGREKEVAEVKNLLAARRLVTVAGVGGVGKTRLAIQASSAASECFPDGGYFVDLAAINDSSQLTQYVTTTLGISDDNCCPLDERLDYYFQDKTMLLILDNCEHVLPGVRQLIQLLLAAAPHLTILSTSREPLGVVGETIWYISPLSTPKMDEEVSPAALMAYEATALFVDRAAAASGFILTSENARAVAQVCARLDGIPLALELASVRTKVLSIDDLAQRLDDQMNLLVSSQQVPQRQQTLRSLIDWSYDLLSDHQRTLLRRLSVFAGSWTLQAAEEICADGVFDSNEVLDLLVHLVDRSLVVVDTVAGSKRYRLLETIRQYSRERLVENQEADLFAHRHAAFYTRFAERSASGLWGQEQSLWLRHLDAERDNLRAALGWMSSSGGASKLMLRCAAALWRYWRIRGFFQEGRSLLNRALVLNPSGPKKLIAEALRGAGTLAIQQGDYDTAAASFHRSFALHKELRNFKGIGQALESLGEIAYYQGDYDRANTLLTRSLELRTKIDDKGGVAISLRQLGVIARDLGDLYQAQQRLLRSLEICRESSDQISMARTLDSLGLVEYYLCHYDDARQLFSEAITIYQLLDDRLGISNSQLNLGNAAKDQGDFKQAKAIYDDCLKIKQTLGDQRGYALVLSSLAELAFFQGRYSNSAELANRSLTAFQNLGVKRGIVYTLGLLAYTAHYMGDYDHATALADRCIVLATELNTPRPVAYCKEVFGLIAYAEGDFDQARNLIHEAIEQFEAVGDHRNTAIAQINLARTYYRQGDYETALLYIEESLARSRKLNARWTLSTALEISGLIHRSQHRNDVALPLFQESLLISLEQDNRQGIANCLGAIAGVAAAAEKWSLATILFAAAQDIRREIGAKMGFGDQKEHDDYLALAQQQMTVDEFEHSWAHDDNLPFDQVLILAQSQFTAGVPNSISGIEIGEGEGGIINSVDNPGPELTQRPI